VANAHGASATPPEPGLVLIFPSETAFLSLVNDLTRKMAAVHFEAAIADRVALAAVEATTNVLEHAYHGARDRKVELRFSEDGEAFRIEVRDSGARVEDAPVARLDLQRYASERRTGGLGIHLMERIMDTVTFRREGRRNVCCLVKRKRSGEPEGA
jgi:anti-sigma regulatory factor (Ser/Thr protein kinase)